MVLNRLVDQNNSVLVIEHNLDVIKTADWVIDLGPEGGAGGGRIVAVGTPEEIAACEASYTGQFLRAVLRVQASRSARCCLPMSVDDLSVANLVDVCNWASYDQRVAVLFLQRSRLPCKSPNLWKRRSNPRMLRRRLKAIRRRPWHGEWPFSRASASIGIAAYLMRDMITVRGQALAGIVFFFGIVAAFSSNLRAVNWRTIVCGVLLQIVLALWC